MKQKNTIPTILGMIVLILGSLAGVFLLKSAQIFKIGADVTTSAKNIRVANISDTSVTISWTTDKATKGFVTWGTSESVNKVANETEGPEKYFNHIVNLTGLSPKTKFFYKINSDGTTFDNSGIPWQVTTGPTLALNKNSLLISGSVINASGNPEKSVLVYADVGGYLMATQTSATGNFVIQIGSTRTNDLQSYAEVDPAQTLVQISVQAVPDGVASAQIFPQSGNPIPVIVIGQTYDFRNKTNTDQGANPNANLNLPADSPQLSKFNVTPPTQTSKPTSIILESLNEGEIVTTNKPQFFGKGPSGTTLTITVHSETTINGSVEIPKSGSWSYAAPSNLEPGPHTITVSWIDVSGITRFLTRGFVVSAGEVPAFTASGSGATASPSPLGSPKPTAKAATATISPTSTASASAMPVPVTGDLTPTLLLTMMGLVVLTFSFIVWKVSEN